MLTNDYKEMLQCLSERALIANKRATGRTQDLADVERLESLPAGNR
jgi:hypothetical protein